VSLFRLFEQRSVENPQTPLTSNSLLNMFGESPTDAGVSVSERGALGMGAVWRCVALVSGVAASLPLIPYQVGTKTPATSQILANPHPEMTAYEVWRLSYVHRLLWGNSYLQKVYDRAGRIRELWPIEPDRVHTYRFQPSDNNPGGKVFLVQTGTRDQPGPVEVFTSREILHIPGMSYDGVVGVSPIRAARQGIALGLAAEKYGARFFGSGNLMGGVLQTDSRLTPEQAQALKERWQAKMSGVDHSHEIAVLDSGAQFHSLTMPHDDAQFLESRKFQVLDIARFFGVPPFLLMETEKATSWGTGLEQQALGWVTFDLHPQWLAPTEQRITREILLDPKVEARYRVSELLRGDSTARAAYFRTLWEIGVLNDNEIRDAEDLPPFEGGDQHVQPLNMAPIGAQPPSQPQASQPQPDGQPGTEGVSPNGKANGHVA
jgi:HK97 family phage portal protein